MKNTKLKHSLIPSKIDKRSRQQNFFFATKTGSKCSLGFLPQVRILLDVAVDQFLNLDGVDVAVLAVTNLESNNRDQPMFKTKSDD